MVIKFKPSEHFYVLTKLSEQISASFLLVHKNKVYFYIFHGSRLWSVYGNAKFILLFRIIVQLI